MELFAHGLAAGDIFDGFIVEAVVGHLEFYVGEDAVEDCVEEGDVFDD